VDLSNYSGRLTVEQVRALRDEGVTGAIVQALQPPPGYPPDVAAQQLAALRDSGITDLQGYVVWWFGNTPDYLGPLLAVLADGGVTTCWLDVEDTRPYPLATRIEEVRAALAYIQAHGMRTGIYTAHWYWTRYMGDCTEFATLPLWAAQYDDDPNLGTVALFGGWERAQIKQYRGTTSIAGIPAVDLNVAAGGPPISEVSARPLDQTQTISLFNDVAKHLGAIIADRGNVFTASEVTGSLAHPQGTRAFVFVLPAEAVADVTG
jgi:hypothetical protein